MSVTLFLCSDILADEYVSFIKVEQNRSIQKSTDIANESNHEEQPSSGASQKIKNFFSGFVDDLNEFAIDNKIINNSK